MDVNICACGKEKAKFMDCCPQCQSKVVKVTLEQRVADLETKNKILEDNLVLAQQLLLEMKQKHNELIDLLQKKGIL